MLTTILSLIASSASTNSKEYNTRTAYRNGEIAGYYGVAAKNRYKDTPRRTAYTEGHLKGSALRVKTLAEITKAS